MPGTRSRLTVALVVALLLGAPAARPVAAQEATPVASPVAATVPDVLAPWLPDDLLGPGWDATTQPVSTRDPRLAAVAARNWEQKGTRVVVFAMQPVAEARLTWEAGVDVFGGVATQVVVQNQGEWQPRSGQGPAIDGCERVRRAGYLVPRDAGDPVPIGITLCAVEGGPVVVVVATRDVDGKTGTAASDAVAAQVAKAGA